MKALPEKFCERMKALLGEENYEKFISAMNEAPQRSFRVNTEKMSVTDFEKSGKFETEKISYCETGFYFGNEKVGAHPYHHSGIIYVQDPAAMAAAESVDVEDDWFILDTCAAPGGKRRS